jgi:hypothetical protein
MLYEDPPVLEVVKELDRLLELKIPQEVKEMIWSLMADVQDYRRRMSGHDVDEG